MNEQTINEVVTALAKALQKRDYDSFVSYFKDDAIFEIPFTVNGGTIINGLPKIKEHFENVRQNPLSKSIEIEDVKPQIYHHTDNSVTVEYFTKGKSQSTGETFEIQSSIALIQFHGGRIIHYKDFPNTIGIAKKAGVLAKLAVTWTK